MPSLDRKGDGSVQRREGRAQIYSIVSSIAPDHKSSLSKNRVFLGLFDRQRLLKVSDQFLPLIVVLLDVLKYLIGSFVENLPIQVWVNHLGFWLSEHRRVLLSDSRWGSNLPAHQGHLRRPPCLRLGLQILR